MNSFRFFCLFFLTLGFVLQGCSSASNSSQRPGGTGTAQTYSLSDVARHASPDDCWMVIHGKVYDMSGYGDSGHPGGQAIYQGCGKDATTLFETRPMGSGTPHSQRARSMMDRFYVGDLKN